MNGKNALAAIGNAKILCSCGCALLAAFTLTVPASTAHANPQGGIVSAGQATITTSGNTLDITQSSADAVINWSSFNIGSTEKTVFIQPSSSSMTLNRINDSNPSQILGTLIANGKIVLVNPNGVFFGPGSTIDVSGLIASTANISNNNFMAGEKLNFSQPGNPNAAIINQGTITAKQAGLVGFVAPNVENNGVIRAQLGKVTLASGDTFTLDMAGDKLISVAVSGDLQQQIVNNTGLIQADGGTVNLTAAAARQVVDDVVSNSGVIQANSIGGTNGHIVLYAEGSNAVPDNVATDKGQKTGTSEVLNSGTLSASGASAGETGGSITVTADNIGILSGSAIDASGDAGGGTIQVGGNFHGQGTTPTALHTIVQPGASIDASAITTGNGGNVTVWADDWTNFAGTVLDRGGLESGNGGYVETSGKHILSMNGTVDASAPNGNAGTWLMDPADVTISTGTDANLTPGGNPNFTPNGAGEAVINVVDITTDLNLGTNVTVTTGADSYNGTNNGQITVATPIALSTTSNNNATLTLSAYSNILFNSGDGITAPTTGSGKLNVILDADNGANGSGVGGNGSGYINIGGNITTNGGNITMGGGNGTISAGSGYAVGSATSGYQYGIYNTATINAGSTVNASGGSIVMNGQGGVYTSGTNVGIYLSGGAVTTNGTGTITLNGTGGTESGSSGGSDFGIFMKNSGSVSSGTGTITLNGTGGNSAAGSDGGIALSVSGTETISASGTANINITGTARGSLNSEVGVALNTASGYVSSTGGNITIIGYGSTTSGTGTGSNGVNISSTASTSSNGTISITGTGGGANSSSGQQNYGVYMNANGGSGANITSTGSGAISVTGINGHGSGGSNYGIVTDTNNEKIGSSSYSGNITLQADTVSFGTGTTMKTIGNLLIEPYTANTNISVASGNITMNSTSVPLNYITAGGITIGSASDTGAMTVAQANWSVPVSFVSGNSGSIDVTGTQTGTGSATISFTGPTTLGYAGSDVTTNNSAITFNSPVTLAANAAVSSGSALTTFGTVNGDYNLTANAGTFSLGGAWGGITPLNAVSLTSTNSLTLPAINAASISTQTTGATADLTLNGQLTASGAGTPVTLVTGRNVINDVGANVISLSGGSSPRWLVYSTNPANNTLDGLTENFHRYNCTYGGSCPSFPSTGDGLLYSLSPTITVTANNDSGTYGSIAAFSPNYSGFINGDTVGTALSGSPSLTTNATTSTSGNYNAGTWTINSAVGTLASAMGYQLAYANGTLTITPKALSITGLSGTNKVYDTTLADPVTGTGSLSGLVSGLNNGGGTSDVVSLNNGTASFADPNVGTAKPVTFSGYTISGHDAGDYALSQPANSSANITPASLTITAKNVSGTYGSVALSGTTGFTDSGLLGTDSISGVSLSTNATASTSGNWNAGTWTVTPSNASGSGLSNYSIAYDNASIGLTIAPKALSITGLSGTNKVYDATLADPVTGTGSLSGLVSGLNNSGGTTDVVTLNNGTASFADPNVGTAKPVTFSGYTISGHDAGDYALSQPANSSANITPASLTVTAKNVSMTYADGTTLNGTTGFTDSGLLGSDSISSVSLATNATTSTSGNWNAGTWTVTPSNASGSGLSNYSIAYDNASIGLTIAPKALSITGLSGTNKVYDATLADPVTGTGSLSGLVSGLNNGGGTSDVVILNNGTGSFADPNVGTGKPVTFSGYTISGHDAGDYTLSQPANSSANITAADLTITAKNVSGTYGSVTLNGTTGFTDSGLLGSDSISSVSLATNATTSTSGNWNAGTWTVTPSMAVGSGLSNYAITYDNASTGLTIAPKALSITGLSGTNKVYDATLADPVTGTGSLSGLVSGPNNGGGTSDVVTLNNGIASFADPNVGTAKPVTFSGYTISGHDAGDYTLSQPAASTANITAADLTITAKNVTGTYGSVALSGTTGFTDSGLLGSDSISSVSLATNATTSTSGNWNAGTWTVTPSNASGSGLSNYAITYDNASTGLTIAPKALSITGLSGTNKVYDATLADPVTGTGSLSGLVSGLNNGGGTSDVVILNNGTGSFADPNVGTGKPVTFSGYTISGHDAGDYTLSQPANSSANITAADLTITAKNVSGTYGSVTLNGTTGFTDSGLLGSDSISSVSLATNATTSTSGNWNAGTWTVTPSNASGSGLSNYSIAYDNASIGLTIAPKALSITGLSGTNKVYDATLADPVTGTGSLSGLVSGLNNGGGTSDVVTLNNGTGSFADPNVGTAKPVTFSGYTISGHDAGDYTLSQPAASTANITTLIPSTILENADQQWQTQDAGNGPPTDISQNAMIYVHASVLQSVGYYQWDSHRWWDDVLE